MNETRSTPTDVWLPLLDYALVKGVSLSTLRRRIKANKLTYKVENGRYLLWTGIKEEKEVNPTQAIPTKALESENHKLALALRKAQEEIAELKTLIAFYEENLPVQRHTN